MSDNGWRVFGASVQGSSHQEKGVPCQDAHQYSLLPDGTLLVAIADGAGSAQRSDEGSQRAVAHAVAALAEALDGERPNDDAAWLALMLGAFAAARDSLATFAEREQISPRALATTLTCAVAAGNELVVGQMGDGAVVIGEPDGRFFTAVQPRRGEYANETFFLNLPDALDHIDLWTGSQPVQSLILTTDGLLRLALQLPSYEPHVPFFAPLLGFATEVDDIAVAEEHLAQFLASDRVSARTDDDKTLVIAVRQGIATTVPAPAPASASASTTDTPDEPAPEPQSESESERL